MNLQTSLPNIEQLPESFDVLVDNISAISVTGDEADKYLQGQLTCDVTQLAKNKLLVGGHCDAKGKIFSAFRLIDHTNRRLLIQSKDSLATSMKELQKFGVFAKVDISEADDLSYLALTGNKGVEFIQSNFNAVPDSFTPVITHNKMSIFTFLSSF